MTDGNLIFGGALFHFERGVMSVELRGLRFLLSHFFVWVSVIQLFDSEWVKPWKGNAIALIKRSMLTLKERREIVHDGEKAALDLYGQQMWVDISSPRSLFWGTHK